MTTPQPYDHVESAERDRLPEGVYRVVGSEESGEDGPSVTLLRLTNGETRIHSGEVRTVSRSTFETLAPAENPDPDSLFETVVQNLLGRRRLTLLALVLLVSSSVITLTSFPAADVAGDVLLFVGIALLVIVGTGSA